MLRQSNWKQEKYIMIKLSKELQLKALQNTLLKQEISQEVHMDNNVQQSIYERIGSLNGQATNLAKQLQNQKRKNLELGTIIRHITRQMDKQKLQKTIEKTNTHNENLTDLDRKFKKIQYDLDQLSSKNNDIGAKNKQCKEKIKVYRAERVIDSGIFKNIEKELMQQAMSYKKLMIQKIKHDKIYNCFLNEYNRLKNKALSLYSENQMGRNGQKIKSQNSEQFEDNFINNAPPIAHANKFTEVKVQNTNRNKVKSSAKTMMDHRIKVQNHQQHYQFIVKKILIETGLPNAAHVIHQFNSISKQNQTLFTQVNTYTDQINKLQGQSKQIRMQNDLKRVKFYGNQRQLTNGQRKFVEMLLAKENVQRLKKNFSEQVQNLNNIIKSVNFQKLISLNAISEDNLHKVGQNMDLSVIHTLFQQIEDKITDKYKGVIQNYKGEKKTKQLEGGQINELLAKMKKQEESDRIMKRQDFQNQYLIMSKNSLQSGQFKNNTMQKSKLPKRYFDEK